MNRPSGSGLRRILVPAAAIVVVATPLAVLTLAALSTGWFFPNAIPASLTTEHFSSMLGNSTTRASIGTGLRVSTTVTALALLLSWPASRVLARPHLPGRAAIVAMLFLPSVLPAVGLAMGVDVVLLRLGIAGTHTGVVIAHLVPSLPYAVAVLTAGLVRHDRRIEAQAAVLGADDWQRLRLVTLPALRSTIQVAAALTFVVSWSQYLLTVLSGSGRVVTITMLLFSALSGGNPSTIGVLALVTAAPATVLLVVAGRDASERGAP